jgi:hypothetical protein
VKELYFASAGEALISYGWHWQDMKVEDLDISQKTMCILVVIAKELKLLNSLLRCENAIGGFRSMRGLERLARQHWKPKRCHKKHVKRKGKGKP